MKKTLLAVAAMAALSSTALAASQVTLYGKLDTAAVANQVRHQDTTVAMKSSFNAGSRWGIRGNEDLGNGYSVGFVLEQGFNTDTGNASSSSKAFYRQSTVQVAGDFGTVAFGRMGVLSSGTGFYTLISVENSCYTTIGAFNAGAFVNTNRADNTILYMSPAIGGLKIAVEYSNGISGDEEKWSENNHYYGIGATYDLGAFHGVAIFEVMDQREGTADAVGKNKKAYLGTLGATYDFGALKSRIAYQFAEQTDVRSQHAFLLGASAPAGGGVAKLTAKYMFGKFKDDAAALTKAQTGQKDYDVFQIGAAYEYPLSKRTKLYGFGGYAHGNDAASADSIEKLGSVSYGGIFGGFTAANMNSWVLALGIQHNF